MHANRMLRQLVNRWKHWSATTINKWNSCRKAQSRRNGAKKGEHWTIDWSKDVIEMYPNSRIEMPIAWCIHSNWHVKQICDVKYIHFNDYMHSTIAELQPKNCPNVVNKFWTLIKQQLSIASPKREIKKTSAMFAKYRPSEPRMIAIMMVMIVKLEKCRSLPVRGENTGNLGSHNKNGTRINSIALVESCTCIIAFAQPSNRTNAFLYDVNHFVAEYSTVIDELYEHVSLSPVVDNRLFC